MSRAITLQQADAIIDACKKEAASVGQPMNIAVVDDGANLVAVGVSAGSVDEDHQVAEAGRKAFAASA